MCKRILEGEPPGPRHKMDPGSYLAKGQPETSRPVNRCLSITPKALWSEAVDFRLRRAKIKKKEETIDEET